MKNTIITFLAVILPYFAISQFIQGAYVEIGINNVGGFEGIDISSGAPVGSHPRPGTFILGMLANPQMNGWATYDGDFFAPGSPENGWGFEVDSAGGISKSNNYSSGSSQDVSGLITSQSLIGTTWSIEWEGEDVSSNLAFKIEYTMDDSALFYTTIISVTNNSLTTIPDLYYYRNLDPDNNQSISGNFMTTNTIVSQHTPGSSDRAFVTATSVEPASQPMSYLGLMGLDTTGWMAGYGGFSNRDASNCYYGTGGSFDFEQEVDSSRFADVAIFLAHRTQNLAPGTTETFKFATLFSPSEIPCVMSAGSVSLSDLYVCWSDSIHIITTGSPAGGTYVGAGITGSTIDPSLVSGGANYTYTYVDTMSGCTTTLIGYLEKVEPMAVLFPFSNVCNTASPFVLTGGYPEGGVYSGTGVSSGMFDPSSVAPGIYTLTYTYTYEGCSSSSSETIQVDNCVGIIEDNVLNSIDIYPNPFNDQATIVIGKDVVLKNAQYLIYDVLGQEVVNVKDLKSKQFTIEKNVLKPGIYFFNILNDGKVIGSEKLIVQ